jgi:hypothetical protein
VPLVENTGKVNVDRIKVMVRITVFLQVSELTGLTMRVFMFIPFSGFSLRIHVFIKVLKKQKRGLENKRV